MIEVCQGPRFCEKRIEVNGNVWKNKSCILVTLGTSHPRGKLNDINPIIAAYEVVVYYPVRDYEKKQKHMEGPYYIRDVCDVLVTSRPWKILYIGTKKI